MTENEKTEKQKRFEDKSSYFKFGLAVTISGAILILLYYILHNGSDISSTVGKINKIFRPFYIGFVITFLLCPIYNGTVKLFYRLFSKKAKPTKALTVSKVFGTVITLIVLALIVAGLCMLIIPDFVESIVSVVPKIEPAIDSLVKWVEKQFQDYPEAIEYISNQLNNLSDQLFSFVKDKILPQAQNLLVYVTSGVAGTVGTVVDVVIALFVCVYFLNGKEAFIAQTKKIILALFKNETSEKIFEFGRLANVTFSGFINGKIIDSIIIGILCFIAMNIMGIPLSVLVSVIIGVTNIIPFFGPIIGLIPSALLIVMLDPIKCLEFIIMVLVLQQLDGNFIGPKILGKSTKLGSFWVMFAIIVGGGLFGFIGMVVGVPSFAMIYAYTAKFINGRLQGKGLETETLSYETFDQYGCDGEAVKLSRREKERQERKERESSFKKQLISIFTKKKNGK